MDSKTIKLEIVTPERVVWRGDILQASVPTTTGEITILPDHRPLVSIVNPGVIEAKTADNKMEIMAIGGGFVEVLKNKIVILADTAERGHELDEERIKIARVKAEKLKEAAVSSDEVEFARISSMVEKELARTKALHRYRKLHERFDQTSN